MNDYRDRLTLEEQNLENLLNKVAKVAEMLEEWRELKGTSLTFAPFDKEYSAELAEQATEQFWMAHETLHEIDLPDLECPENGDLYENVCLEYYFIKKQVK